MQRLLAVVFALVLALGCGAQRHVRVQLDDGETLAGTVVAMDLTSLQVRVGDEVRTIDAARIRSCRFDQPDDDDAQQPAGDAAKSAAATAQANASPNAPPSAPRVTWRGPLQDPVDPTAAEQAPHDVRGRSRLRQRLELLDERRFDGGVVFLRLLVPNDPSVTPAT